MKKEYVKPEIKVVQLNHTGCLMQGSGMDEPPDYDGGDFSAIFPTGNVGNA